MRCAYRAHQRCGQRGIQPGDIPWILAIATKVPDGLLVTDKDVAAFERQLKTVMPPFILEFDEKQHFNQFRALTLEHYQDASVGYDMTAWSEASKAKRGLEGGGFAKSRPPLFAGENGRHKQRAFRDALCDLLPPKHGFAPTLRIADFEVRAWLFGPNARSKMVELLESRLLHYPAQLQAKLL